MSAPERDHGARLGPREPRLGPAELALIGMLLTTRFPERRDAPAARELEPAAA